MLDLIKAALSNDRRSLARLISLVEDNPDRQTIRALMAELYPRTGQSHVIGITGAPGVGKSQLVNQLAKSYRAEGKRVGVIAVDPTSPFSGGALLGDRVRMRDLAGDPDVFLRSMASRGHLGGLARAAGDAIQILDAVGFPTILVETVGTGQGEVEVAQTAHTIVVVDAPGLGDEIQSLKAGVLEIADIFVVNKADRDGVDATAAALEMMLDLNYPHEGAYRMHHGRLVSVMQEAGTGPPSDSAGSHKQEWRIPVLRTVATEGRGLPDLLQAVSKHRDYLAASGEWDRRNRIRVIRSVERLLTEELMDDWLAGIDRDLLAVLIGKAVKREMDPYRVVMRLMDARS